MIDLYTWSTPNGRKVSIMLEECELPYEVHEINIGTNSDQFQPHFLEVSPNNKIPAIIDRENGYKMFESGAILMYLADKTGRFLPPHGELKRMDVIQWLMFQMGGPGPFFGQIHHFARFAKEKIPYAINRYVTEGKRLYGVMDRRLADHAYLGGDDYSIADIATWPWVSRFEWHELENGLHDFPNVRRWYNEIAARPAVQRGYDVPKRDATVPLA